MCTSCIDKSKRLELFSYFTYKQPNNQMDLKLSFIGFDQTVDSM